MYGALSHADELDALNTRIKEVARKSKEKAEARMLLLGQLVRLGSFVDSEIDEKRAIKKGAEWLNIDPKEARTPLFGKDKPVGQGMTTKDLESIGRLDTDEERKSLFDYLRERGQ